MVLGATGPLRDGEEEEEEDECTVIGRPLRRRLVKGRTSDSSSALHLIFTLLFCG